MPGFETPAHARADLAGRRGGSASLPGSPRPVYRGPGHRSSLQGRSGGPAKDEKGSVDHDEDGRDQQPSRHTDPEDHVGQSSNHGHQRNDLGREGDDPIPFPSLERRTEQGVEVEPIMEPLGAPGEGPEGQKHERGRGQTRNQNADGAEAEENPSQKEVERLQIPYPAECRWKPVSSLPGRVPVRSSHGR